MALSQTCCLLLLLEVLAFLGSVYGPKQGCRGNSTLLFQNIHVDQDSTTLILYVNGNNYKQIAMWVIQKCVRSSTFLNGYGDRISLDQYGNIWIRDLHDPDEGNYTIEIATGNVTRKDNVELNVFVAPDRRCKPKIIPGQDTITAYLEQDVCGKPAATPYWLEQPGISIERNEIKLTPGQDAGTVYACIDSPALICVENAKPTDYCTVYKDERRIQKEVIYLSTVTTFILVLIILEVFAIIVGIPTTAHFILYRRIKHMLKKKNEELIETQDMLKKKNEELIETQDMLKKENEHLIENQDMLKKENEHLIENQGDESKSNESDVDTQSCVINRRR